MANRNWNNQSQDWDPMRDDYNDSTFDAQYPDHNSGGGVQLNHCRLYITNIPRTLNEDGVRTVFAKYGSLVEVYFSMDQQKRYAMVTYETPGEAKLAMMKLNRMEPLKLNINIAHKKKGKSKDAKDRGHNQSSRESREDTASTVSRARGPRKSEDTQINVNGEGDMEDLIVEDDLGLNDDLDSELHLELVQLKMEHLKLQEAQLQCKQRMLILNRVGKKPMNQSGTNRCILPDGRIVVRNINDRTTEATDTDSYGAGSGDANEKRICACGQTWDRSSSECSSASTCVHCEEKSQINLTWDAQDKSDVASKLTDNSKITDSMQPSNIKGLKCFETDRKRSDTSERRGSDEGSGTLYEFKFSDFTSEEDHDETNRLIQLRNSDYTDVVDDHLKVVISLNGYPKLKMRLKQMENFQKSLTSIIDMQLKAGLLKKMPSFLDYYLNRGAIVCICRDTDTRDWVVRVSIGLEERMNCKLMLLGSKVKRLCLGLLKIPQTSWPATAIDVFKLLQYFNPTLKTDVWKIYAQKIIDDVECTSFLIDRVSGEIIRGPTFKNVIDYSTMEFELTGYTEIYYESFMSELRDGLSSVASRVKLLEELKSEDMLTTNGSSVNMKSIAETKESNGEWNMESASTVMNKTADIKKDLQNSVQRDILKKLKDVEYINDRNETIVWSVKTIGTASNSEIEKAQDVSRSAEDKDETTSLAGFTVKTDSFIESNDNLVDRNSTVTIDSNRGIAYHRRTNYLHVDTELKVAITLDGYPQNKLEGTHIRRLKRLFKEYLHKDIKNKRFTNLIIPKFQDVFLSNGAVIYICDSLETKEYLAEILPKFMNSTSMKLVFKDVTDLVRYTRVVMRLPKELAHLESKDIINKLLEKYPSLKPDCWKYYSDVAGKQKRQFGVDPQSVDIIKSPDFEFYYEGEMVSFRIIDRKRKDVNSNEMETSVIDTLETEALWDRVSKEMYCPIGSEPINISLTRIRTNHYSDFVADDLKLYLGPSNYPETRIDENLFYTIKNCINAIVLDSVRTEIGTFIPKIHDIYLFDGVIFVICKDVITKHWIEDHVSSVNSKLYLNLKSTEFRGAVGIVSMLVVKTDKDTDEVISVLQKQNPRLRTKYWRKISIVRSRSKLDVVLQIDKLSAQVISNPSFNKFVGSSPVLFKLGHLQSLIKPKTSLEYIERKHDSQNSVVDSTNDLNNTFKIEGTEKEIHYTSAKDISKDNIRTETRKEVTECNLLADKVNESYCKLILKVPTKILPDDKEDFDILLDLLEDKNPGLNTELWKITNESTYPGKGKFTVLMDKQSASVIKGKNFDSTLGGEKLKFLF